MIKVAFLLFSALLVTGCSVNDGFADLDEFMRKADAKPSSSIDPLPEVQVYRAFKYSASNRRAPFQPPEEVILNEIEVSADQSNVKPDFDRPKEVLESFTLGQLSMVGTLRRGEEDVRWALISDGSGGVHMAKVGQYMGRSHGRIVAIEEGRLDLIEIVPNGHGGWLERPRTISLDDE